MARVATLEEERWLAEPESGLYKLSCRAHSRPSDHGVALWPGCRFLFAARYRVHAHADHGRHRARVVSSALHRDAGVDVGSIILVGVVLGS